MVPKEITEEGEQNKYEKVHWSLFLWSKPLIEAAKLVQRTPNKIIVFHGFTAAMQC